MENQINWNNFFNLYDKAKCGNDSAGKELTSFTNLLYEKEILTKREGYMVSCKGSIQDFFGGDGMEGLRFSEEIVAHNVVDVLRKRNKSPHYSVVSINRSS